MEAALTWFLNRVAQITTIISDWWATAQETVKGWIDAAKLVLQTQLDTLGTWLTTLQEAWDNFVAMIPSLSEVINWFSDWWANVLPNLTTWWAERLADVQGLIDSAFTARDGLWSGWQELKSTAVDFFGDPVEFIWQRFADWFLGPEV